MYKGSCLCGKVVYQISGEISSTSHCHCNMCQKQHGAPFGSYGNVKFSEFEYVKGKEFLAEYESSEGVLRKFCKNCGSTLEWFSEQKKTHTCIALGTLDTRYQKLVTENIYTETRVPWLKHTT